MEFNALKAKILEIAEVSSQVPETFRDRCFELLLTHLLATEVTPAPAPPPARAALPPASEAPAAQAPAGGTTMVLPGAMKAFMRRNEVSEAEIEAMVMIDGEELHYVKEPTHQQVAKGQNEWALLIAMKNGILSGGLTVDAEAVRSIAQEKGYYDRGNFSKYFKGKYAPWYKDSLEPQGEAVALSITGEKELAALIKSLVK